MNKDSLFDLGTILNLKKPLAFFDLETTDIKRETAKIVEIAIIKINPDQSQKEYRKLINPGMPIPPQASSVHGIYDADVAQAPLFGEVASEIYDILFDCDLAGFNSNQFDIPILMIELERSGYTLNIEDRNFIDVLKLFHLLAPRNLTAAYKYFCNKELTNAHSALADVQATYEVFMAQVKNFDTIPNNMQELHKLCNSHQLIDPYGRFHRDEEGDIAFSFGQYRNMKIKEVFEKNPKYIQWVQRQNFPQTSLHILNQELQRLSNF